MSEPSAFEYRLPPSRSVGATRADESLAAAAPGVAFQTSEATEARPAPESWADSDRVARLFQRGVMALAGHAIGGVALLMLYASLAPSWALTTWGLTFLFGWLVRAWVVRHYRRAAPLNQVDLARAQRAWELTTVASGIIWGVAVAMLFPYGTGLHRMGLVMLAVSYCLAAQATSYAVFLVYTAACFLPIVVHLALSSENHSEFLAIGVTTVFLSTLVVARQDLRTMERLHALKRRDAQLVRQLEAERNAAQSARDEAQAAHRAKSQFYAAANHDLRQPLHAMALFTRSLMHHPMDEHGLRLVHSVDEAIFAMERLFDQLLDLDRIDGGALTVRLQAVEMEEIYRRVRVHVEAVAFDKGLALTFRGGHHRVHTDPLLLERVLRNLVSNAIRYTEDGGVLVSCRPRAGVMALQIWDTGIGIASASLPQVFDEFYQIDAVRRPETGEYRGMGLGLAIVRRLLQLLDVPLVLRSRQGHGTVFTLLLPRDGALASAAQPSAETAATSPPAAAPHATAQAVGAAWPSVRTPVPTMRAVTSEVMPKTAPAVVSQRSPALWQPHVTLTGRHVLIVVSEWEVSRHVAGMLRGWSAVVTVLRHVQAVDQYLQDEPYGARPDLLIVSDQVAQGAETARPSDVAGEGELGVSCLTPASTPEPMCSGLSLTRRIETALQSSLPTILLVPTEDELLFGLPEDPPDLHRLGRPVRANRLRALVTYKLGARNPSTFGLGR